MPVPTKRRFLARLRNRRRRASRRPPTRFEGFATWAASEPGASILAMEQALLSRWLADLFGFYALQIGTCHVTHGLADSRIRTRLLVAPPDAPDAGDGPAHVVRGYSSALPVASDSVDVVVMPHVLEYERDPHAALREAYRVLRPEGTLVITGFNPASALGLGVGLARRLRREAAREGELHLISPSRARDWLSVLGLELDRWEALFLRPPLRSRSLLARLAWIERVGEALPWVSRRGAGVYALLACKRVAGMTPLRPLAGFRTRLVPPRLVGASSAAMAPAGGAQKLRPRPRLVMVSGRLLRETR